LTCTGKFMTEVYSTIILSYLSENEI